MNRPFAFQSLYFDTPIVMGRTLDIFTPANVTKKTALFFVHGGGWRAGSRAGFHALMQAFAAEGHVCGSTDYRLSGTILSDQLTDCRHGYDLFLSELKKQGRPLQVVVFGGSAGALLAALLSMTPPGTCGEAKTFGEFTPEIAWTPPIGVVLSAFTPFFTPWEDIFPGIWQSMEDIAGMPFAKDPERYEKFSPIRYVTSETPPMFISHAENEHMFPLENLQRFQKAMHEQGRTAEIKVYSKAEHGFFYDVTRRQQKEIFEDVKKFLSRWS